MIEVLERPEWVKNTDRFEEAFGVNPNDVIWDYQQGVDMTAEELLNEDLYTDEAFKRLMQDQERLLALDDVAREKVRRWAEVNALRKHYARFEDFLYDVMTKLMGFQCSDIQIDIGQFIADESRDRIMVQAQRSQAKSTIVAIFAVWKLIHNCRYRVLIVSAGSDVALEIANWVIQIIMTWDRLECLRPDRHAGDRSSTKAFDINWMLKGAEKSPSVACIGITANMQGRRADLLIPDDIESSKNGLTETQRMALENLSKDFTSICQKGRICYMGTPQTVDSIYKNLPKRGYTIRIWPGRYPTEKELPQYGDMLAPLIADRIFMWPQIQFGGGLDGKRGWCIDPVLLDEASLQKKELDQGPEYFQLQHMLDTTLSDENRYPLKPRNLIIMDVNKEQGPGMVTWMPGVKNKVAEQITRTYACSPEMYHPFVVSDQFYPWEFKYVHIDPAGGGENADEIAVVAGYLLHGYVHVPEVLALQGGHTEENLQEICDFMVRHMPQEIGSEQNMGHGAFAAMLRPMLARTYEQHGLKHVPAIIDVWESQQKELRIIETLSPVMARHRLIIAPEVLEYDYESTKKYSLEKRDSYKLIHQFSRMSRERGAVLHDDRLDTLHAVVRRLMQMMAVDESDEMDRKETDENIEWMEEWGANISEVKVHSVCDRFKQRSFKR